MKKSSLIFCLALSLFPVLLPIFASNARADDDGEYNFSWLDPDKKIYVLQNRKYKKAKKVHLSVLGGSALGETYRQSYQMQPRIGYWINEDFGLEVFYSHRFNSENNAYKALIQALASGGSASPMVREINSQLGVLINWAPWYAKINVFNSILYFDWYFSLGAGTMNTSIGPKTKLDNPTLWKDENIFAVYAGTGHLFHISKMFDVRFDFLGYFYSAPIYGGLSGAPLDTSLFSNYTISLGLGVKL